MWSQLSHIVKIAIVAQFVTCSRVRQEVLPKFTNDCAVLPTTGLNAFYRPEYCLLAGTLFRPVGLSSGGLSSSWETSWMCLSTKSNWKRVFWPRPTESIQADITVPANREHSGRHDSSKLTMGKSLWPQCLNWGFLMPPHQLTPQIWTWNVIVKMDDPVDYAFWEGWLFWSSQLSSPLLLLLPLPGDMLTLLTVPSSPMLTQIILRQGREEV